MTDSFLNFPSYLFNNGYSRETPELGEVSSYLRDLHGLSQSKGIQTLIRALIQGSVQIVGP